MVAGVTFLALRSVIHSRTWLAMISFIPIGPNHGRMCSDLVGLALPGGASMGALQAGRMERAGRSAVGVLAGQDDWDSSTSKSRSAYSRCSHSSLRMTCRHRRTAKLSGSG